MNTNESDERLVDRAREGDYRAFETLVDRHSGRLYGLAAGIVREREDAADIVQTTFLNAIEHLNEFRGDSSFGTWITRIAMNNALKHLRKRRGLETVSLDAPAQGPDGDLPHPEFIADWRYDPAHALERGELRSRLELALDRLPEGQRLVFLLRDVQGLSVAETAEALGIKPGNVKVRLLRARLALREELTRAFGDPARRIEPHGAHGVKHPTEERS